MRNGGIIISGEAMIPSNKRPFLQQCTRLTPPVPTSIVPPMTQAIAQALPIDHPPASPRRLAIHRFTQNRLALLGLITLLLLTLVCLAGLPYATTLVAHGTRRYEQINFFDEPLSPGQHGFVLGTDRQGRDMLARLILGGAISLGIGITAAALAVVIGTTVGLISGYAGGRIDALLMRCVDVLYSLPYILIVILLRVAAAPQLAQLLDPFHHNLPWAQSQANVIILLLGIGGTGWLTMARIIRGQVMSLRHQPFVEAAHSIGLSPAAILRRHILPNLTGTIIVYATLTVPKAILEESFLSFLGLGISAPLPSWGNIAADGVESLNPIQNAWWLVILPSLAISITLLSLNFAGDGLRDAVGGKR